MKTKAILAALLVLTGCVVGPDYHKPDVAVPAAYKEAADWKKAEPKDDAPRGRWWEIYRDADLNALASQVQISNQNVLAAAASYRQAQALLAVARAGYLPTVTAGLAAVQTRGASPSTAGVTTVNPGSPTINTLIANLGASWEPDVWGQIRRTVEAGKASAQASEATLGNALLSAQGTLVQTYLQLRVNDAELKLIEQTVSAYERSLQITKNLYESGVDSNIDVAQAETLLETSRAQAVDLGVQRAQLEHAVAVLIGRPPADFQIKPTNRLPALPQVPSALPSELLERRPDIAAAERLMAAANAQIGVAQSAFYPALTLSGTYAYQNSSLSQLFSAPSNFWSLGPSLAMTLFKGGALSAQKEAAVAAYEGSVAGYRQTVLAAFQEVEDNLAALRHLADEAAVMQVAEKSSARALALTENQYEAGTVGYLPVVTARATLLNEKITNLSITGRRLVASASLIPALGGDWRKGTE